MNVGPFLGKTDLSKKQKTFKFFFIKKATPQQNNGDGITEDWIEEKNDYGDDTVVFDDL